MPSLKVRVAVKANGLTSTSVTCVGCEAVSRLEELLHRLEPRG